MRVTAPQSTRAAPTPPAAGDPSTVYVRSLIRSQLRVAVVAATTFAVLLAGATAALAFVPELRAATVGGLPLVWIVLGVGVYPVVLVTAWLFVRAADRNERRYRSLAEEP